MQTPGRRPAATGDGAGEAAARLDHGQGRAHTATASAGGRRREVPVKALGRCPRGAAAATCHPVSQAELNIGLERESLGEWDDRAGAARESGDSLRPRPCSSWGLSLKSGDAGSVCVGGDGWGGAQGEPVLWWCHFPDTHSSAPRSGAPCPLCAWRSAGHRDSNKDERARDSSTLRPREVRHPPTPIPVASRTVSWSAPESGARARVPTIYTSHSSQLCPF